MSERVKAMSKAMAAIQEFMLIDMVDKKTIEVFDENTVEVTYSSGYVRDIDVTGLNSLEVLVKVINCI